MVFITTPHEYYSLFEDCYSLLGLVYDSREINPFKITCRKYIKILQTFSGVVFSKKDYPKSTGLALTSFQFHRD